MPLCTLCPRSCGADRAAGQKGYCGVGGTKIKAARAALHMWEEPCISGSQGSGTVFFSGCPLRCVYCQNRDIARAGAGKEITVERLSEIFLELQEKGAANINLVTPTHYTPEIVKAVAEARDSGLTLPIVYNCGGYEKPETLRTLEGIVDIYLTDFKYMDAADHFKALQQSLLAIIKDVLLSYDHQIYTDRGFTDVVITVYTGEEAGDLPALNNKLEMQITAYCAAKGLPRFNNLSYAVRPIKEHPSLLSMSTPA